MLRDGARIPVHRRSNGGAEPDFVVADEKIPLGEMHRQIESEPHQFSANVLLRPVVQDYLLPTLAYVGGAAEIAYFGQGAWSTRRCWDAQRLFCPGSPPPWWKQNLKRYLSDMD